MTQIPVVLPLCNRYSASLLTVLNIIDGNRLALIPGVRLGSYEILSALGAGGMGEVYRARDTKLNRIRLGWSAARLGHF